MNNLKERVIRLSVAIFTLAVVCTLGINLFSVSKQNRDVSKSVSAIIAPTAKVQASADGVVITKKVEQTAVNGKYTDEAGNPYLKISFSLDASEANDRVLNYGENTKSTDVVLMLDTSHSMKGEKFTKEKLAAMDFVEKLMVQGENIRLCVITFDRNVDVLGTFSKSKAEILNSIKNLSENDLGDLTDLQGAIIAGQRQMKSSSAGNKVMVILTDGEPNLYYSGSVADEMASKDAYVGVTNQAEYAKNLCPDAVWYTIGYDLDNKKANDLLKKIASENENGGKLYYSAAVSASGGKDDLQAIFNKIAENISIEIESNKLVDTLPEELTLLDIFESNDKDVLIQRSEDDKTITFSWGDSDIQDKVYNFSFVVKANLDMIPKKLKDGSKPILTNGKTIDTNNNVVGSSYFAYAGEYRINLYSPAIYVYAPKPNATPTPTPEPTPTPKPEDVIKIYKSAQWVTYNGKQYDENGNSYIKISFNVDMRYVALDDDSHMSICDTIPKEFTYLDGTMNIPTGATATFEENKHIIKISWGKNSIDNKRYYVSFLVQVNKNMLPEEVISGSKATIYTNGPSVYQPDGTNGSSVYQYGDSYVAKLDSPKLEYDLRNRYKVTLHLNGGYLIRGSEIFEYVEGEGVVLPGPFDAGHYAGYGLIGWYDNPQLVGKCYMLITADDSGDKELWGKWAIGPGHANPTIKIDKSVEWTGMYDENANPITKFTFNIDMTDPALFFFNSYYTGEKLELVYVIDASQSMKDSGKFDKMMDNVKASISLMYDVCIQNLYIGVVACSSDKTQVATFTNSFDRYKMMRQLDTFTASGDTDIAKCITEAGKVFEQGDCTIQHRDMIVISDGYSEAELCNNADPYTSIKEARNALKENVGNIEYITVPYDADEKTVSLFENFASNNERGAWLFINTTDDDTLYEESFFNKIDYNIIVKLSDFDDSREHYSAADALVQCISYVVEEIGAGVNLLDYVPKEYTVLQDTIFYNSDYIETEFNEADNTLSFSVANEHLKPLVFKISFEAALNLDKIPDSCINENGIATVYTNGYTVSEYKEDAASIRYGMAAFTALGSPKLDIKVDGKYKVQLHSNGGLIAPSADVTEYMGGVGAILPSEANIEKANCRFLGWYDNPECIGTRYYAINKTDAGDKEFWAKWEQKKYNVYLITNGGTLKQDKNVHEYLEGVGAMLPTEIDITKQNYSFAGWYDNSWFGGDPITEILPTDTGDKMLYAKWSPDSYNVILHTNGGTITSGKEVTKYEYGRTTYLPTLNDITYDDPNALVVFSGWYDNPEFTGKEVVDISPEETGDKEFWAKWIDISSLKNCATIYVYGLEEVGSTYKAQKVILSIGAIGGKVSEEDVIKVWVGATENPLSGQLTDVFELRPGVEQEVELPKEIVNHVGIEKQDAMVYLHIEYGSVRLCTEIKLRFCAAFKLH